MPDAEAGGSSDAGRNGEGLAENRQAHMCIGNP
jgi:hypothetical protein